MFARLAGCVPDTRRIAAMGADLYDPRQRRGRNTNQLSEHRSRLAEAISISSRSDHARIYLSGDITDNISVMFNTDYNSATNNMGILDAVGQFHISPRFNVWFGRFLPPSDRAQPLRSVLLQRVGRIYGWHPGRLSRRLSGPRQWRSVLGRFQSGDSQDKSLRWRIRRRFRRREFGCHLGRPRPARFLGSGGRLLPEQHLLWGQKPARYRRGNSGADRQDGHNCRFPHGKESDGRRGLHDRERVFPTTTASADITRTTSRAKGPTGLHPSLFRKQVGMGKFEVLGKYAMAEFTDGLITPLVRQPELSAENHGSGLRLHHQAVRRALDELLQETPASTPCNTITGRPASACSSRSPRRFASRT